MYLETYLRTLVKTISWRFWATGITAILVMIFTGETEIALAIGGFEVFSKMAAYFIHERIWNRVNIGKVKIRSGVIWLDTKESLKEEAGVALENYLKEKGIKALYLDFDSLKKSLLKNNITNDFDKIFTSQISYFISTLENQGITVITSSLIGNQVDLEDIKRQCKNNIAIILQDDMSIDSTKFKDKFNPRKRIEKTENKRTSVLSLEDQIKIAAKHYFANIGLKAV